MRSGAREKSRTINSVLPEPIGRHRIPERRAETASRSIRQGSAGGFQNTCHAAARGRGFGNVPADIGQFYHHQLDASSNPELGDVIGGHVVRVHVSGDLAAPLKKGSTAGRAGENELRIVAKNIDIVLRRLTDYPSSVARCLKLPSRHSCDF
jgi:hypothetical protein